MLPPRFPLTRTSENLPNDADAAPLREASVVHETFGRVRVHLPHWSGTRGEEIAAQLRRLDGVTYAEANPLTGNVLIRFEPARTSVATLLESLPLMRLDDGGYPRLLAADIGSEQSSEARGPGGVVYATGAGRVAYQALGWGSVGMAVVGAIMPGIPTAPFVVLAGYFFTRSSPAAHEWLRQTRAFGPILRDWEDRRGVRRSIRNAGIALIGVGMAVTAVLGLPLPVTVSIITMQVIGVVIILNLRVVEPVPG